MCANLYQGWNVRHFYSWYRRDGGTRSYGWMKDHLQKAGAVGKSKGRGKHRSAASRRRDRGCCRTRTAARSGKLPRLRAPRAKYVTRDHYT